MSDINTETQRPFLALASKLLVGEKPCPVRFLYKTVPANLRDTGWRMYSGYEDESFLADKKNMMPYPVETLLKMNTSLEKLLDSKPGTVWERIPGSDWQEVHDYEIPTEGDEVEAITETKTVDELINNP
ncbi:DUF2185 domain-containing protein [Motiliproteus sp. MSK22-1]|uniref:immunity protein Imm33 domain-containing protein n=1 Tax=Motiliproteus sp. MSK22-1 TaxID=1897630 RepID=UPI0009757AAC|nr:DUF2185 domain-containing protein [Motiliproteus sp. MSK22-1]OMH29511.1 hypothetical protein BGP75_19920 [Motiliproteus sp. MSK22-1]